MPLTVADVLDRASVIIQDQSKVRWPQAELLKWLNDGRRELAIFRPDIYSTVAVVSLALGTRQDIPADGSRFLDAIRNMSSDGVTPLAAVRIIQREFLDALDPSWHTHAGGITQHFMLDERVPRTFFVYPPAIAAAKLEIAYAQSPADITDPTGTTLTREDLYTNALIDYVLYRAFSKDATFAGNQQRAAAYYSQFSNAVGQGDARDMTASPNNARTDGTPPQGQG